MDFAWTDEQFAFRQSVIKFAQQELNADPVERDYAEEFSGLGWKKCGEFENDLLRDLRDPEDDHRLFSWTLIERAVCASNRGKPWPTCLRSS